MKVTKRRQKQSTPESIRGRSATRLERSTRAGKDYAVGLGASLQKSKFGVDYSIDLSETYYEVIISIQQLLACAY